MGEMLTSPDVAGNVRPVMPAGGSPLAGVVNPAGPDGPVVAGGPVGPCEMPSPSSEESQDLSEHAVLIHADPAGQHAAVGTLSASDCYPAGPAGPYVAGGPVGPDDYLQVLEPFEHLVLDHADPAGQHADIQDTVGSLEHSVVETILDGRPMEGIMDPELLEHPLKLPDTTLDGGLVEKITDWEPVASPVPDSTLDGRLMEGTTNLEHSVLVGSLDSGLMAGMLCLEPLEQSVLNTLLVAQPGEGITEEISDWEPVAHLELEDAIPHEVPKSRSMGRVSARDVNGLLSSPENACLNDKEMSLDEVRSERLRQWSMDMDVEYQYETFNGLPVYYGGDMYDSEDSEEYDGGETRV